MPDISMCGSTTCPLTQDCYRHADSGTKPNDPWQTYSLFEYGDGGCASFWSAAERSAPRAASIKRMFKRAIHAPPYEPTSEETK